MTVKIFKRTPLIRKGRSKGTYVAFHRDRGIISLSSEAVQKMKFPTGIIIFCDDDSDPSLIGFGPGDPDQTDDAYPLRRSKRGGSYYISATDFIRSRGLDISDSPKCPAELKFCPDPDVNREVLFININNKMPSYSTTKTKDDSVRKEEQPSLFPNDANVNIQMENIDERLEWMLSQLEQDGQKIDAEQRVSLKQTLKAQLRSKVLA